MSLLTSIRGIFAGPGQLPADPLPKPPNKPVAVPSYKTQVAKAASALPRSDRGLANTSIVDYRVGTDTRQVVRDFAASSPDLSATIASYLRVGIPSKYTVIARDMDGTINVDATKLSQEILRYVTFLGDASLGYNPVSDLQSLSESMGKELLVCGAMSMELALDKARRPAFFNAVSVTKLTFKEEEGGVYPVQTLGGVERSLDIPTFFYVSVDQDLLSAYSSSYFEASVQAVIADAQFLDDLRKSMQRVIQPRLTATIIEDKVKQSIPPEIANDPVKLGEFYNTLIAGLQSTMENLNPEDVLVSMDSVTFGMLKSEGGGGSIADTLRTVQKLLESKVAAGARTMPAVMGREEGSGAASTSAMLFLKNADIIRRKLNLIYSRALTQAARIMGQDVYVEFEYAELDLRPDSELEAYKSMRQSRILEQLSLGFITDEQACIELTGNLPRDGHVPLAGTMFKSTKAATGGNPDSQTSNLNKGGAPDNIKPPTPANPKR